jgi:hypothetical protein
MIEKQTADKMERRFKREFKPFLRETIAQLRVRLEQLEHKYPQGDEKVRDIAHALMVRTAAWLDSVIEAELERAAGDYDTFDAQMKQLVVNKIEVLLGERYCGSIQQIGISLLMHVPVALAELDTQTRQMLDRQLKVQIAQRSSDHGAGRDPAPHASSSPGAQAKVEPRRKARAPRGAIEKRMKA